MKIPVIAEGLSLFGLGRGSGKADTCHKIVVLRLILIYVGSWLTLDMVPVHPQLESAPKLYQNYDDNGVTVALSFLSMIMVDFPVTKDVT